MGGIFTGGLFSPCCWSRAVHILEQADSIAVESRCCGVWRGVVVQVVDCSDRQETLSELYWTDDTVLFVSLRIDVNHDAPATWDFIANIPPFTLSVVFVQRFSYATCRTFMFKKKSTELVRIQQLGDRTILLKICADWYSYPPCLFPVASFLRQ